MSWKEDLRALRPCVGAWTWAQRFETWQECWEACPRGDWLLWVIGRTAAESERKKIVQIACSCARLALPYTKDPRVLKCIEVTEAWVRGEATLAQARRARDAAYDAATATDAYAATYAADAAYAAAYAAYAPDAPDAPDAAYDAAYATDAADAAAEAAYADAEAAYADTPAIRGPLATSRRKEIQVKTAEIVRGVYPLAPNLKRSR